MAKKNTGGRGLDALTMRQTDRLARDLAETATRLVEMNRAGEFSRARHETLMEIFEVADDLHRSWMSRHANGE